MGTSAFLLLNNGIERIFYQTVLVCIIFIAPSLRWSLQGSKEVIGGPWEIAHIKTNDQCKRRVVGKGVIIEVLLLELKLKDVNDNSSWKEKNLWTKKLLSSILQHCSGTRYLSLCVLTTRASSGILFISNHEYERYCLAATTLYCNNNEWMLLALKQLRTIIIMMIILLSIQRKQRSKIIFQYLNKTLPFYSDLKEQHNCIKNTEK